ncbi:thioredoxin family protein [Terribacillus saccharophilus]|uniref:Thioredoxin n=1 Tax=Terribacillus saccharophilus TaxID=361277 RepID=A0A075LHZ0_9BACI|nr:MULTISPECIES: thioredoxin family protein [Terribacillus]AIF65507.1 thioredoxin [Terribacillus goriensis]MCM3227667.1 thioredoxin family protein [Terribacillus saccharophilus]MEC0289613.1 thioredoxin family protein [Terribacillus saccharophilus]MEC0302386.1 thioredoxin family protein [Terribacillus saccharophilus]SEN68304.1 Thioredoxin [Terribacillus saccharophilus]
MEQINTKEKFKEIIVSEEPVIVKFFADWCPDCTRMNMFIDQVLAEYGNYKWYELNNDEVPDVAAEQDVMGIPSILLFQNGEKLAHLHSANAKSPEEVISFLQQQLG